MRNVDESKSTSTNHLLTLKFLDFSLRLSVIPLSIASIWVMVTNKQVNIYGKLEFNNLMGLKYLVCINAISAGYALVAVVLSWLKCLTSDWVFFVSDQVLAYLMVTSGSAVIELLYLLHNGDKEVSWSEACTSYGRFCLQAKVSLVLHLMALVCFLILCLISAYKLFSKFEAPYLSSSDGE